MCRENGNNIISLICCKNGHKKSLRFGILYLDGFRVWNSRSYSKIASAKSLAWMRDESIVSPLYVYGKSRLTDDLLMHSLYVLYFTCFCFTCITSIRLLLCIYFCTFTSMHWLLCIYCCQCVSVHFSKFLYFPTQNWENIKASCSLTPGMKLYEVVNETPRFHQKAHQQMLSTLDFRGQKLKIGLKYGKVFIHLP